jgi:hypothetical protein
LTGVPKFRRSPRPRAVPVSEQRIVLDDHLDEVRELLATPRPDDPLQGRTPVQVREPELVRGPLARRWARMVESTGGRLIRGRAYLREGAVLDLQVQRGLLLALVQGTRRYHVKIVVSLPVGELQAQLRAGLVGAAGLRGPELETVILRQDDAIFPAPRHLVPFCQCQDTAPFCKHVCAALYGFGVRLDDDPGLLLVLRGLTPDDAAAAPVLAPLPAEKQLHGDLGALFGIELIAASTAPALPAPPPGPAPAAPDDLARPDLREVSREYLRELGVPTHTIDAWLREGVLQRTHRHGIYVRSLTADRRLADYEPDDPGP